MNLKGTFFFVALTVILGFWTFRSFKKYQKHVGLAENEIRLVEIPLEQIIGFSIKSKTETIELAKNGTAWRILQPVNDEANEDTVAQFLSELTAIKVQSLDDTDWKKYGLDDATDLEVRGGGQSESFLVATKYAFDGSYYIRRGSELLYSDRSVIHFAERPARLFRSHSMWRERSEIMEVKLHLNIDGKKEDAVLSRNDKGFTMQPTFDLPASDEKIKFWMKGLRSLIADEVVEEHPSKTDLEKYLLSPSLKAEFKVKDGETEKVLHWEMSQPDPGNFVFVHTDVPDQLYRIGKNGIMGIIRAPAETLLDASGVLKFPIDQVTALEAEVAGKKSKTVRDLADLLRQLTSLEVVAGLAPSNIKFDSGNRLVLRAKEKVILDLRWKIPKDEAPWLKIGSYREQFRVPTDKWAKILLAMTHP